MPEGDQIGSVWIGVGAKPTVAQDIEAAKGEAVQKAEELGQAIGEGIVKGTNVSLSNPMGVPSGMAVGPFGGNAGGVGTVAPGIQVAPAAAGGGYGAGFPGGGFGMGAPPPAGAGSGGGSGPTGAGDFNASVAAFSLLAAQIDHFEQIGEKIGSAFFEGAKQNLELTQAIKELGRTLAAQQSMTNDKVSEQARGVGGRPAGTAMQERLNAFESDNQTIDERLGSTTFGDVLEAGAYYATSGLTKTTKMQLGEQAEENEGKLNSLRRQRDGLLARGRQTSVGAALAMVADEQGVGHAPTLGQSGPSLSPVEFQALVRALRESRQTTQTLTEVYRSFSGTQRFMGRQLGIQGN